MRRLTVEEILKATGGELLGGSKDFGISGVSTDSRKASEKDIFFPLKGENFDAHSFLPQVIEAGCKTLVVSKADAIADMNGLNVILVEDTKKAMQNLAKYYLESLHLKKLAVTGSVGKTSTRDMLKAICSQKYRTGGTVGNLNNDIGVPLTIFSFDEDLEAAVIEMGMDDAGQIRVLADIVRPDTGVITNVGISHIEHLGSREGILAAKMEITEYFDEGNTLVINQDCDLLQKDRLQGPFQIVTVGSDKKNEFTVSNVCDFGEEGIEFKLGCFGKEYDIRLMVPGAHNALNAGLAIAACYQIGVDIPEAIAGLASLELTGKRLTIKENNGIKVIDDTYNACPDSMKSAINTLMNTKGKRKVAILGDMFELGEESPRFHREVGEYAGEKAVDLLITLGELGKHISNGAKERSNEPRVLHFSDKAELILELANLLKEDDVVLVKASRGMAMEEIVEKIMNE